MISSSAPTMSGVPVIPSLAVTLRGVGTAVPAFAVTQESALQFLLGRFPLAERTKQLYKKTFANKSIHKRHFSLDDLSRVMERDLDKKNARFQKEAIALSTRALQAAFENAGATPGEIDFLIVTTCTGYICPGLSAYLVESCGLRRDTRVADLVGMGCGAAIPALEQAHNFLIANPGKTAAVVSTEICSAAMVSNDDVDIVISNTIFADGSAAAILSSPRRKPGPSSLPEVKDLDPGFRRDDVPAIAVLKGFSSLIVPEWRETLRFKSENGHLRNVLGKNVPQQSAIAMKKVADQLLSAAGLERENIHHWLLHAGGDKVLNAMERELDLSSSALSASRAVLKHFGNMSSATVLFVLAEQMRMYSPVVGDWGILGSFGAGFSAHGALVQWI